MSLDIEQTLRQARAFADTGNHDDARGLLLEALTEDPDNQAALLMLGGEYFTSTKYSEAEMVFERLILQSPGKGQFSIALFNTLWKMDRHEEALEEIKRFMANANQDDEVETLKQYAEITEKFLSED